MRRILLLAMALVVVKSFGMQKEIFNAIDKNNEWLLEDLIVRHKIDLNAPEMINQYGEPAIVYATIKGLYKVVTTLIKHGAKVNAKSSYNKQTSLYHALQNAQLLKNANIIELLLQSGAYSNNCIIGSSLYYCFIKADAQQFLLLLKYGFSPNTRCTSTKNPVLCYAITSWMNDSRINERGKKIIHLLEWGANPYKKAKMLDPENFFELVRAWHYPRFKLEGVDKDKLIANYEIHERFYKLLRKKLKKARKLKNAERHDKTRNFFTHPIEPINLEKIKEEVVEEMKLKKAEDFIRNDYKKYIRKELSAVPQAMPALLNVLQANRNFHAVVSVRCPTLFNL